MSEEPIWNSPHQTRNGCVGIRPKVSALPFHPINQDKSISSLLQVQRGHSPITLIQGKKSTYICYEQLSFFVHIGHNVTSMHCLLKTSLAAAAVLAHVKQGLPDFKQSTESASTESASVHFHGHTGKDGWPVWTTRFEIADNLRRHSCLSIAWLMYSTCWRLLFCCLLNYKTKVKSGTIHTVDISMFFI